MGRSGDGKRNILWGWPYDIFGCFVLCILFKFLLGHPNKMFRFPSPSLSWRWVGRSGKKKMNTWKVLGASEGRAAKYESLGRFPFDQIFWFEIPGIPCDEWNSIFRFVGLTNPWSSGSTFRAKIRDQTDSFTFASLLWGCSTTLKLK